MGDFYKPYGERTPDNQYRSRLRFILKHGVMAGKTPQGIGALTAFGTLPPMVFDLSNGAPVITNRSIGKFWRKPISEILAFARGERTIGGLVEAGCDYWDTPDYHTGAASLGLAPGDLGPGSYGAAFHDFPKSDGSALNQYEQLIDQIRKYPDIRTHLISPWIPYYTARGEERKVVVAPCHGWQLFRVLDGKLHLTMWQRSADFPIGVPSNMVQYAAVLMMVASVTGYEPGTFVHQFGDAHIYEDQLENVRKLVERTSRRLPTLRIRQPRKDFFEYTADDFELTDYNPHPGMKIPFRP